MRRSTHALRLGHCGSAPLGGDCQHGHAGSWRLNLTDAVSWSAARKACSGLCLGCNQCSYISFSLSWRDCSWWDRCDLERLQHTVRNFRTLRIRSTPSHAHTVAAASSRLPSLSELGHSSGTDKGWVHGYLALYEPHLAPWRAAPLRLLEVGVRDGDSLHLWDAYFTHPNASIFGAGIGHSSKDSRILHADQGRTRDLIRLARAGPWTVVIDDGSHLPEHQLQTFVRLFPTLVAGGLYIVEDIETSYWRRGAPIYSYRVSGRVDVVDMFRRAIDGVVYREFLCDGSAASVAASTPVFSAEVDAMIASVSFIRNSILVRKLPANFVEHKQYRFSERACANYTR